MDLNDLYKLAGIQRSDTPAVEPQEVEQQVIEEPTVDGREDMKAMIALVSPEQLNKLVGNAPVEEDMPGENVTTKANPQEFKGTLGSPADLSLRRYLGANGMPVSMDESSVYKDLTTEELSEAYFNYKLDEAPRKVIGLKDPNFHTGPKDLMPMPMPDPMPNPMPRPPMPDPMPDPRDPDYPDPMPMPDPGPPNDPTPFPRPPMPDPGPPNDPTPFPRPPEDPTPFPGPKPKDPPGEPIPEPRPEPGPPIPIPGGGPEEPPKPKIGDPDEGWYIEEPGKAEEPKDPIDTKIDPKDLDGDSPADPKDPNWDLKLDALGRNIQTSKEREEMFQKYGLTPPRDVLKAQMKREQDRRDRTNKVGFDKLYNDRDEDTLNSTYVSQRDENGNIIDPNPKESTMNEEPNEGNEFTGALANAKKAGKKEFKVDGKTYQVEAVEQLHADMNRMRKLSGLTESTIMERPGLENKRGYDPFGSQEPETRLKNQRGFDPFGSQEPETRLKNQRGFDPFGAQEPPQSLQGKRGFDPFGGAPGDEGDEPEDPMGGMGEPSGEPAPRVPDAIGPTPTPPKSDPIFDPFGGAPGDEGDDPEDPMGGMGEPGGPADPPAGTRPPDAIGPTPTPPASGTRPPDAIGPTPTDPATPSDGKEKPKAPEITAQMRKDAEEYADRDGLPLDQLGTLVPGTVGGIPTTLEVDPNSGTVIDTKTGDVIGGDDADAAREAAKGRTPGLGNKSESLERLRTLSGIK